MIRERAGKRLGASKPSAQLGPEEDKRDVGVRRQAYCGTREPAFQAMIAQSSRSSLERRGFIRRIGPVPGLNRTWRKRAPRLSGAGNFWMSKFQGKSVQENNVLGNRIPSILLGKFVAQSSSQNSAFGILVASLWRKTAILSGGGSGDLSQSNARCAARVFFNS